LFINQYTASGSTPSNSSTVPDLARKYYCELLSAHSGGVQKSVDFLRHFICSLSSADIEGSLGGVAFLKPQKIGPLRKTLPGRGSSLKLGFKIRDSTLSVL
jgi:hypothetical protein